MKSNSRRESGSSLSCGTSLIDPSEYSCMPVSHQLMVTNAGRKLRANSTDIDNFLKQTIKKCENIHHEKLSKEQRMVLEKQ